MAVFTAIAFATLLLEDDHFLALYQGYEHFTIYFSSFYGRSAYSDLAVGIQKKYFVEDYFVALFGFFAEMMNIQVLAFFGFELLSFDFYNSVHC